MDNLFLTLTKVTGETLDAHYPGAMEIFEWKWGLSNSAPYSLSEVDATKQTSADHVTIEKFFDIASTTLATKCAHGSHIDEAKIICRKNAGDEKFDYLIIVLKGVKILSVKWGGRGEEARGIPETLELSFKTVHMTYKLQDATGLSKGQSDFDFDLPEQKAQ